VKKELFLIAVPVVCMAGVIQIPGQWTLLRAEADPAMAAVAAPVPREFSGQPSTLAGATVLAADGVAVTGLKGVTGVRIAADGVAIAFPAAKDDGAFAAMQIPPAAGAKWYGSSYWTGGETWARVGKDWLHPGNACDVARVFIAPADGCVTVSGTAKKLHLEGDGVRVAVQHNAAEVWAAVLDGKDAVGKATDNKKLQAEGKAQKAKGAIQNATGSVKGTLGNKI